MPRFRIAYLSILLSILCSIACSASHAEKYELQQLHVLFRHGDRTPEAFPKRFPNDPNMNSTFHPDGPGNLRSQGKLRMYRLGEFLRSRYSDFLGSEPAEDRLFSTSSSLVRTRLSLQLVLAGLYPASISKSGMWHDKLDWRAVPSYYHRFKDDRYFNWDKCEMYEQELTKVQNSTEVQTKLAEFSRFLQDLKVMTGKPSPLTLDDAHILHDILHLESEMRLPMLPWMRYLLKDVRLKRLRMLYYEVKGFNLKLRRLSSGYLLRRMSEDMTSIAGNRTRGDDGVTKKVSLYSAHDKNIITLLQLLGMYDGSHMPQFGSALIFELLTDVEGQRYRVKMLYYLGIPEEMTTLTIPGCETVCPLDKFVELTEALRITDEELNSRIKYDSYFQDTE